MVRAAAKNHAHVGVRHRPGRLRGRRSTSCGRRGRCPTRPGAGWPARRSPTPPPTTRRSSPGSTRPTPTSRCRPTARTSPSSGRRSCATARTRTSAAPATAPVGATSWWDGVDPARRPGPLLPQPLRRRGGLAPGPRPGRRDRPPRRVAIIKHANPCGAAVADIARPPTGGPSSATSARPSAASSPSTRRSTTPPSSAMVAAAQADLIIAPGYAAGRGRPAAGQAQEHPAPRGRRPSPARSSDLRQISGGLARPGAALVRGDPRRLAGRHQAPRRPRPSGPTPSWRGASCG